MSKHQIVWTIPGYCGVGGIIGMHYFSRMRWPLSFHYLLQVPSYAYNHLVQCLYQAICFWVVGHGLQSFDAKDLAHFLNHTTSEASTSITQEPGQGPKDRDVTLVQKFSNGFCCLIGSCMPTCFVKWSWKTKTLVTLGDWFDSNVVSMLVKSTCRRSRGAVATVGHKGALGKPPLLWRQHVQALMDCLIWLTIPGHQNILVVRIGMVPVLVSCTSMTPIQTGSPMCLWHHKE